MTSIPDYHENLQPYYGNVLQSNKDFTAKSCYLNGEKIPASIRNALDMLDNEILEGFASRGSSLPPLMEGLRVLDLGCGTGKDVYVASVLVGENGYVIGVDMGEEQLAVGRKHLSGQMGKFGFKRVNVDFRQGYMEDLADIKIDDNSIDLVISNCGLSLSQAKEKVFSEIFRVLKPGGELYFADVFTNCRIPQHLQGDPVLLGECLAGALYIEDFRRLLRTVGCNDYRTMNTRKIDLANPEIEEKIGLVDFLSMNIRAFKLNNLEDICEDYGQVAVYRGTIPENVHYFDLDDHHRFITGKPMLVCGNTAAMLAETRLAAHFQVDGDRRVHYGPFDCAPAASKLEEMVAPGGACC